LRLDFAPLAPWLASTSQWSESDKRAVQRARADGYISDTVADRLMLRYAGVQLELVHPDYTT